MPSRLEQLLDKVLRASKDPTKTLRVAGQYPVKTPKEARLVCQVVEKLARLPMDAGALHAPWKDAIHFFQHAESKRAFEVFRDEGLPILYELYDASVELVSAENHLQYDLDFLLKIFAMYGEKPGIDRLITAARNGFNADGTSWSKIFHQLGHDHPFRDAVLAQLSRPLPPRFIGVAFLDWANHLALAGRIRQHPFDSPEGKKRLHDWLVSSRPEEYSYAHSATAALPFLSNPERDQLLALAMDHQDEAVQMEAAWASSKLGSESGLKMLGRFCLNLPTAKLALSYLEELERPDRIPAEALDPDFQAQAEMYAWLMHPHEFGRPPDELTLVDKRDLHWPPTDDRRTLWLFKYRYAVDAEGKENIGLGMVGSVTFALFGETTADMDPLDAYALHCCWELQMNRDKRAPRKRSIAAGRRLLRQYNE